MQNNLKNLVLITIDQWRFDFLGANGFSYMRTPNLDNFAKKSALFVNHRSVTAPCGPARNSLLTGRYQHSHHQYCNGTPTKPAKTNLALQMRKNGVWPVLMGYTDQAPEYDSTRTASDPAYRNISGLMDGFDQLFQLDDNYYLWNAILKQNGYGVNGDELANFLPCEKSVARHPNWFYARHPAKYPKHLSMSAVLTDRAVDFLRAHHVKDPFFLHVTYLPPHPPYIAPQPYNSMYRAGDMPKPVRRPLTNEYINDWVEKTITHAPNQWMMQGFTGNIRDMSVREVQELRAVYAGLVSEIDDNIQRVFDQLQQSGLDKNTMVVITADHGDMLGDHYLQAKLGYWDQSYHIPLIIHNPTRPNQAGRVVHKMTESVDIMPTICESFGWDIPRQCQGASLNPLMAGETPKWRTHTMMDYYCGHPYKGQVFSAMGASFENGQMNIIQDEKYKLVHLAFGAPLLFDLQNDPHCYKNLAQNPKYARILAQYYQILMTKRNHCEDKEYTNMVGGQRGQLYSANPHEILKTRPV